ncbi:Uma2 family endonuclease [Eubacteriales bacterium OttesenSCG-928-A19]|nr:Uma2 family endonuclease [Eubacteriales bacterium OttesenSCG-928-A19]
MQQQQRTGDGYTYADYITWNDGNRYELIDGEVYMMDAPKRVHQEISAEIFNQLYTHLKGKTCKAYYAPFDVRLNADTHDNTVVQPDLVVICDPSKLDDTGCKGAPDLIVEILSPSTMQRDQTLKFNLYLQAGVREYWMVYPDSGSVQVNLLEGDRYAIHPYSASDAIPVSVLDGFAIDLSDVFPPEEPVRSPKLPDDRG